MTRGEELEKFDLLFSVELCSERTTSDQVRSSLEPINETGLRILDAVTIARKRSICHTLIHDQLHILYATTEMSVKVSSNGGISDFILLIGRILGVGDM